MKIIYRDLEVPIMTSKINIEENYLQKCIQEIYYIGDEVNHQTNVKADMSFYDLHIKNRTFKKLIDLIINNIYDNFPHRNFINEEAGKTVKDHFLNLNNFWSAIYKEGDFTIRHMHNENDISFCFYLQSDEKSSPLFFEDVDLKIKPEKNLLVAFPSFLNHSVEKQVKSEKDRIIVSGNLRYKFRTPGIMKVKNH